MKIEVHLLQNFAPACLNRDDTNTPKDCEFGGVRRARISSQCFKRAMRLHFRENESVPVGERTKLLKKALSEQLQDLDGEALSGALDAFITTYYSKMDSKAPDSTAVLLFLSRPEIEEAVTVVREEWEKLRPVGEAEVQIKKLIESGTKAEDARKKVKVPEYKLDKAIRARLETAGLSPDIALFGRMLAEQTSMKVEASCQVAQAISTHRADLETDFYSAADDLQTDRPDAGMLGVTGFNSACFYRYALLDFEALQKNLKGDVDAARQAVEAFLRAAVEAIPTGKQNSMAAQNPPSFGLFIVRDKGMPLSLANAFVAPVDGARDDLVGASIAKLDEFWGKLIEVYGEDGKPTGVLKMAWFSTESIEPSTLSGEDKKTFSGAIKTVMSTLPGAPNKGGAA
jgi:CRISPR system Cascade subunit CasC